jgi:MipA family protein
MSSIAHRSPPRPLELPKARLRAFPNLSTTHDHNMSQRSHHLFLSPTTATLAIALKAVAAASLLAASQSVPAQSDPKDPPYGLSGSVGLGVATLPTYEGSPNRRTLVVPDLLLSYRTRDWGTFELGQRGLVWHALEAGGFRLGLVAGFDPGRKTDKPSAANPRPGDKRLAGMGDVRASDEVGVDIGYGPVTLAARHSPGDRGHQGVQVDLSAGFPLPITERLGLRFGASATWADEKYLQAYFGVTAAQAAATSFRAFAPKAGLRKAELTLGADYSLASRWKLQGSIAASMLRGDAAKSPLVARKSAASASVGVAYAF